MSQPAVHLICNAHLDPVWQWRWEEGAAEALATFRTAARLLRQHPDFIFCHNEAVLYQWVERYDPALFMDIERLVAAGRWAISGGWFIQPDANLPGTESLIRHIIEGRRWFKNAFGAEPRVAYNFDSFGHSGGLPQLLRRAGYEMYIHMRPQSHELALPADLYRWRGVDGSEVVGYRMEVGLYHTERDNIEEKIAAGVDLALRLKRDVPVFWGLGDHGGGATRDDLEKIDALIAAARRDDRVHIFHSTPDRFYEAVAEAARNAPVVKGDLQRAFTGCYTSLSRLKRRAVESLGTLVQSEAAATAAWWLRGDPVPTSDLSEAWHAHIFNDFHDILTGSCVEPAERDALDLYGKAADIARRTRLGAAAAFGRGEGEGPALPVAVLNANPVLSRAPVEFETMADYRPFWKGTWHLRLFRHDGREIPCQEEQPEALLPFNDWRRRIAFMDELPGVGAAHYFLKAFPGKDRTAPKKAALPHRFDTRTGLIRSLRAGTAGEVLAGPLFEPLVIVDEADSWGTETSSYGRLAGCFHRVDGPRVLKAGPVRTITQSAFEFGKSRIILDVYAYPVWPVLEFRLRITWNETRRRLKLRLPTRLAAASLLVEVPGGAIR
ncbi:MAG: hypothetical protein OEW05_11055, partial [Candidatus Aminicenantes bacterium]|nr:hypothetical protein [Candidatus Aminicenantes bacterium]